MKRYILLALISLTLLAGPAFAVPASPPQQAKEKSEAERFIKAVSRIKSTQIDYAYISTNMFKSMFGLFGGSIVVDGLEEVFASPMNLRRLVTTGDVGYRILSTAMQPFMQEEEEVMGMELMSLNREDGALSAIYGDTKNLLVVNDDGGGELTVVFIVGLTYNDFIKMTEGGVNFDF